MIAGNNPVEKLFTDSVEQFSTLTGPDSTGSVIENLERRRNNVLKGGVNCIPLPFSRFRNEVPGIEQGQYVVITANQKVSFVLI